ncbi:UNVERIFIED_CONTAM: hypothetical protein Slati_3662800 [Sesamum latifolium]|uniref:Uncharacterized protein n=1 Tax=Sesamum latifolium TaxID=2727402 RepID=A0AAW2U4U6_9LAMI
MVVIQIGMSTTRPKLWIVKIWNHSSSEKPSCCNKNSCSKSVQMHKNDGLHDTVVEEQKCEHKRSASSKDGCSEKGSCCEKHCCSRSAQSHKNDGLCHTVPETQKSEYKTSPSNGGSEKVNCCKKNCCPKSAQSHKNNGGSMTPFWRRRNLSIRDPERIDSCSKSQIRQAPCMTK